MITNKGIIKSPVLENVPEELKSYKQWVAWKAVFRDNNKITKLPVNPILGWNASTSNPTSWGNL